jgi:hypothetical protein
MFQVGMFGHFEISSDGVDPVAGLPHEIFIFVVLVLRILVFLPGHVLLFGRRGGIEYRWIVAAVKIDVCFREQMIGEQTPAISQENFHDAILAALAPGEGPWLEISCHGEA